MWLQLRKVLLRIIVLFYERGKFKNPKNSREAFPEKVYIDRVLNRLSLKDVPDHLVEVRKKGVDETEEG